VPATVITPAGAKEIKTPAATVSDEGAVAGAAIVDPARVKVEKVIETEAPARARRGTAAAKSARAGAMTTETAGAAAAKPRARAGKKR
jgi:hypothetical protein